MFGKCTFCRYNGPDLTFSTMPVERSLTEYETLIRKYKVKEIFDDSGVSYAELTPVGSLRELSIAVFTRKIVILGSTPDSNIWTKKLSG